MKRKHPVSTSAASRPAAEIEAHQAFSSLRPDPASLFSRASVATTVALVNAVMIAGSVEAQTQAPAKPAPSPVKKTAQTAQTAAVTETTAVQTLPEVVVTAASDSYKPEFLESPNYTAPLLDIPQTINVIPQAVIEEQNATTLRDVLRNVPGISMQAGEGGVPAGDNLSIRGFSARTDFYVDGIRDIGGYTRDPFNLEQVEVAKGPGSVYAGRGSTGGSINLVTKTPKLVPFYQGDLGIGTDQYKRFTLDLNQPITAIGIPGTAFRINALWTDLEVPGRDWVDNNRWGIAPSLAFGLGTDTRIILSYFHMQADNVPDYGIPWVPANSVTAPLVPELRPYANSAPPVSFDNWYGLKKRDYEKTVTDIGTFEIEHDFSDAVTLRNVFRFGQTSRDSLISAARFVDPTVSTDVQRSVKSRDQVERIIADQVDLTLKFETFSFEHTMNLGFEYAYEYSKNNLRTATPGSADPTDLYNPNSEDFPSNPISDNGFNEANTNSVALYLFDTVKLHEQLELSGGLRWDYFDVDYSSYPLTGPATNLGATDNFVSWRIGPVYKPLPNGSIYIAYGTSFNPSAEGLTLSASTAELEPETTSTFEMGTKWDLLDNRLSVNASIFRIQKENARTPGLTPDDPPTVLEGEQRVDGLELGIAGNITRDWKVYGGYTYMNSQIMSSNNPDEVGKRLPNAPQQTFSLWTTYDLPWNITIGGGAQYVGSRFNNATNQRKAPDYWTFDAMLSYQITKNVTARLNVYNLADERYIDSLGGGHFIPGPGRSGTLTVSFKF